MKKLVMAVVLSLAGCPSGSSVAPPVVKSTAPDAKAGAIARGLGGRLEVRVVLDDPRLEAARGFERAKDYAAAAQAMRAARPADLSKGEACGWDYVEGRLLSAANQGPEAAAAFERAEDASCPLVAYARLRGAQALGRASRGEEALAKARAVGEEIALKDEAKLVISDALASKGDRAGALTIWREWLKANPYGPRWVDTTLRIANALADGVAGPPEQHLREAYDLANKVVVEAPKLADSSGATSTRQRIALLLKAHDPKFVDVLTDEERAKQAQAWLDNGEPQKAFDAASAVLGAKIGKGPSACKTAITRANAAGKLKPARPETWNDAVSACEKDEQLANALYSGAKARSGKEPKLAVEWYGKIEQLFPTHRLADDARFRAGLVLAQSTEEAQKEKAEQMLSTVADTYPSGDMGAEALFRAALARMQRSDWEGAKPMLDKIVEIAPEDRHPSSAGRAEYFRARAAAATGDIDGARARWTKIVERHPLTFYMLLSYGRLAALDAVAAKKTLDDAALRDREDGERPAPTSRASAVIDSPAFVRAVRLLDVGETDAARREMTLSGAVGEGADLELTWTVAALYNQAGSFDLGHALARSKSSEFLPHYPEGRWRTPWEVAYPRAFAPIVVKACGAHACPTTLAWGIMREESSFIAEVKSHANAVGLMQIIGPTARWMAAGTPYDADEESLKRPEVSVELGVKLLAHLRTKHGHPALAIGAYNSGSGAVDRWMRVRSSDEVDLFIELIPYDETRNYTKRVLFSQAVYAYLYDPTALSEPLGLPLRFAR